MKRVLFILFLSIASLSQAQQIEPGLAGTDFWFTFLRNSFYNSTCAILIASEYDCTAYIEDPVQSWSDTVSITADSTTRIVVPNLNMDWYHYGAMVTSNSWHVTTTAPAVVYASNFMSASHDMTSIMPTPSLRNDYITQTYGTASPSQEIAIVAPYDNTHLHVTFAENVYDENGNIILHPGDETDLWLMRGEVYHLSSEGTFSGNGSIGFTGTEIQASKPVSVFQGHKCSFVPIQHIACDHLYEQTIPTDFWGRHFVVMPTAGRQRYDSHHPFVGDLVKITALNDNCKIFVEGQPVATINSGKSYSFYLSNHDPEPATTDLDFYKSDALSISSSSPIMVCFYITGCGFGGMPGDPACVYVPPLNQAIGRTISVVFNTNHTNSHFVNIVVPNDNVAGITLDGTDISSDFTSSGNGYSYARITTGEGTHVIDADTGRFLATFYGLGTAESYAYIAGMATRSAEYNVRADRYRLCQGDTTTITFIPIDEGLSVTWNVDGQTLSFSGNTLAVSFDSAGLHRVAVVVNPVGDTVWEIITVLPSYIFDEYDTIPQGQSVQWRGQTISEEGTYTDSYITSIGCDSIYRLHLLIIGNIPLDLTTDAPEDGICLGDTVHLYATPDTALVHWISTPHDPGLDAQSTQHVIAVCPTVTTTYTVLENLPNGPAITIPVTATEDICLVINTPIIVEVDDQFLSIDNCSPGATLSQWLLSDGREFYDTDLRCYIEESFDDSISVTLHTCWDKCCVDTTVMIPIDALTWKFPNVITPNGDGINDIFAIEGLNPNLFHSEDLNIQRYNRLTIYNRWGKLVYDVYNYDSYALNGVIYPGLHAFSGDGLSDGTYYYSFEYHGESNSVFFNGSITIIR